MIPALIIIRRKQCVLTQRFRTIHYSVSESLNAWSQSTLYLGRIEKISSSITQRIEKLTKGCENLLGHVSPDAGLHVLWDEVHEVWKQMSSGAKAAATDLGEMLMLYETPLQGAAGNKLDVEGMASFKGSRVRVLETNAVNKKTVADARATGVPLYVVCTDVMVSLRACA